MNDTPDNDRTQFLDKIGFGFADNGRTVELRFMRKNGKIAYVQCDYNDIANLVLKIQGAAGHSWELQRQALGGHDPRLAHPLQVIEVDRFQGGYSTETKPIISVVLKSGLRLELGVPEAGIRELIDWLEDLQTLQKKPKRPRN